MWGFDLHSWEQLMLWSLGAAALAALAVTVSTTAVVLLQKEESEAARHELELYKLDAGKKISAAEAVGQAAQADIAKANAQIAASNARTKEAELKLEQLRRDLGPRQFKRDLFIKEITGQPSARVEIMYLQDDAECFGLAQQIWLALESGKWPVEVPKPIPPLLIANFPTAMSVGGQPSGVTVVGGGITQEETDASTNALQGKEWVKTPWTVLMHALGQALGKIGGSAGGVSPLQRERSAL